MQENPKPIHKNNRYEVISCGYSTPCWEWQLYRLPGGYGQLAVNGKTTRAHRHYYELKYGEIPKGKMLDHLCGNRACVNPDHMEAVTNVENIRRGKNTKLTRSEVEAIRKLDGVMSGPKTGAMFGVGKHII